MKLAMVFSLAQATMGAATQAAAADEYHVRWDEWLRFHDWRAAVWSLGTFGAVLVVGLVLAWIFKPFLQRYTLTRATLWLIMALTVYFTLIAAHPVRMMDKYDVLGLVFHKSILAILLMVALRYVDRLIILPLLTRIGGAAPSRFIHQIILVVMSIFVLAGYCSWAFGVEIGSFLAGSAVISIVLGLALQETLGNFFSGMVLQASVPFKTGDWIKIGDAEGRVVEMTWRAVTLLTWANNYVLLPNSTVSKEKITNYHTPTASTSVFVEVGVDYAVPPNEAKRVLLLAARDTEGVLETPAPWCSLGEFGDSSINYKVGIWIDEPSKHASMEQSLRVNIWYRLNQAGYGIPFPIRTVQMSDADKGAVAVADAQRRVRLEELRRSDLFGHLPLEMLEPLAAATRDFYLGAGQYFYRQGDEGESLYLIVEGTVVVTLQTEEQPPRTLELGEVTGPDVIGEGSAVTRVARTTTARAKTDVRAIEIGTGQLHGLFAGDAGLMEHVSQRVAKRQALRQQVLSQRGAPPVKGESHEAHSVLERMRGLFGKLGKGV